MLIDLLRELASGTARSRQELTRRLAVSDEMLGMLLDHLVRLGYLAPLSAGLSCGGGCARCPASKGCAMAGGATNGESGAGLHGWVLTPKGLAAAAE